MSNTKGPFVIRCGCTGGYLATGRRVVFRKEQARSFTMRSLAEMVFSKEQREEGLICPTNPLEWEILAKSEAQDLGR